MDVMKIPYFTNIILDVSNPIVLVRAATETECENGPVQSPCRGCFHLLNHLKTEWFTIKTSYFTE
jgi:hypothetical protein